MLAAADELLRSLRSSGSIDLDGLSDTVENPPEKALAELETGQEEINKPATVAVDTVDIEKTKVNEIVKENTNEMDVKTEVKVEGNAVGGEEEPMDCEEAMEVDNDDDDEIVFNIKQSSREDESLPDNNQVNLKSADHSEADEVEEVITCQKDEAENHTAAKAEEAVSTEKVSGNEDDSLAIPANRDLGTYEQPYKPESDIVKDEPPKAANDSSDEEFMSADEEMEVDYVKTPAKAPQTEQESETVPEPSPGRTPPKVGYTVNFDELDLDNVNPFATGKSLMNSPDAVKANTSLERDQKSERTALKKDTDLENKKNESTTEGRPHIDNTAEDSEKKSLDTKTKEEELSSEKPVIHDSSQHAHAVDAKNIQEIRSNKPIKGDSNAENESVPVSLSSTAYFDDIDLNKVDPFKPKKQIINSPDKLKSEIIQDTVTQQENTESSSQCVAATEKQEEFEVSEKKPGDLEAEETMLKRKATHAIENEMVNNDKVGDVPDIKSIDNCEVSSKTESCNKDIDKVEENDKPTSDLPDSPAIPVARGTYNLDFLDMEDVDPFKPKKQMTNSPVLKNDPDPFRPKAQLMNSPVSSKQTAADEKMICKKQESKQASASVNKSLDLEKEDVVVNGENSGEGIPLPEKSLPEKGDETSTEHGRMNTEVTESTIKDKSPTKTFGESSDFNTKLDDIDNPFQPKSQIQNSPVMKEQSSDISNVNTPGDLNDIDPFKPRNQMKNSPVSKPVGKVLEGADDSDSLADPFKQRNQMQNSPVQNTLPNKDQETVDNSPVSSSVGEVQKEGMDSDNLEDPFKPKNQMKNSPITKPKGQEETGDFGDIDDPFKPRNQMKNSPVSKPAPEVQKEAVDFDNIEDPFKPKKQMKNSPVSKPAAKSNAEAIDFENIDDPFKPKNQMKNSPVSKSAQKVPEEDVNLDDIEDPFKPRNQMKNSPVSKPAPVEKDEIDMEKKTHTDTGKKAAIDPFADLDPFQNRNKMADSPNKAVKDDKQSKESEVGDPFEATKQLPNSPANSSAVDNPFATKSKIPNSPEGNDGLEQNPFVTKSRIPNSPSQEQNDPFKTPNKA